MAIHENNVSDEAHESGNSVHSTQSDQVNNFSYHLTSIQVSITLNFTKNLVNIFNIFHTGGGMSSIIIIRIINLKFTVDDQRIQNLLRRKC